MKVQVNVFNGYFNNSLHQKERYIATVQIRLFLNKVHTFLSLQYMFWVKLHPQSCRCEYSGPASGCDINLQTNYNNVENAKRSWKLETS